MKKDISGVVYEGNKITVNAALDMDMVIYSHPGDNIELNIDITNLRKEVVSGDLLIFTPSNKVITLVNFAGMVLEGLAPKLKDASRIYENPEELFLSRAYKSDSDVKKYVIFREVSSPDVNDEPGEKLSTARMLDNEETAIAKKIGELYTIEQNVVPQFGPYFQDYQIRTLGHSGDFVYDSSIIFISNVFKRYKEDFDFTEPNIAVKVKPKIVPLYGSMYEVDESIISASGGVYVFMQNGGGRDDSENAYRSMYSAVEYDLGQAYFGGDMALYVEDDTNIHRQFKVDFTNPYVKVNTIQISGLPKGIELYSVDPSNVRVQKAIGSGPSLYIVTNNGGVGGIPLGISYTWDPTNPLFLGEGKVVKVNVSMDGVHSKNNNYLYGSVNFTMVFNTVRGDADVIVGYNTFTFSLRPDPMIIDLTYGDDFVNAGAGDHTYQTLGGDDDVYMFFPEDDHGVFFSTRAYLGDGNDVYHAGFSKDDVFADASYVGDPNQDLAGQFVDVLYLNRVISSKYGNEYTFSFSGNTLTASRPGASANYSQFEIIYLENANDYSTAVNNLYDYTAVDIDNGLTFNGTNGLDKNVLIDFGGEQSGGDTVLSTVSTQLTVVENDVDPNAFGADLYVYQISSVSSGVSGLLLRDLENLNLSNNYSDVVIVNDEFVNLNETLKVNMGDSNVDKDSISFVDVTSGEIIYYSSSIQVESGDTFIGGTAINLNVYGAEEVRGSEANDNTFYGSSNSGMDFYGGSSNDVVTYAEIINNGVKVDLTLYGKIEVNKIDANGIVITGINDTLYDIESVIASNQNDIFLLNENDSYVLDGDGGSNTLDYGTSVVGLDVEIDVVIATGTSDFTTTGTVKKNYNTDDFVNFQNIVTSDSNNDTFVINYDPTLSSTKVITSKYDAGFGGYDTIDYSSFDVFLELDVSLNAQGYYSISYAGGNKVDYFKNFEYIKLTKSADQVRVDLDSVGDVVIDAVDSSQQDPNNLPSSGYYVDTLYVYKKSHEYKMQDYTNLQNFKQVVVSDTTDFKVFLMKNDSYTYLIENTTSSSQHKELVVNGFASTDGEISITYGANGSIVNWDTQNPGAKAIGFNIVTGYVNQKNIFNVSIDLANYSTLDVVAFNGSVVQTEDTLDLTSSALDSSNPSNGVVFNLSSGQIYYNDAGQYSGAAIATFSEFEKFIGTAANDIFIIDSSLSAFYTIDGGIGTDYVSYELSLVAINKTEDDITTGYAGIEGIIATSYNDYFDLRVDSKYVNVGGGGGFDTVDYTTTTGSPNVTFNFAVDGSVTVAESGGAAGADNLSRFESYIGTGGVDKFIFANTDLTIFVSPGSNLIIDGDAGADEVSFNNKSGVTTSLNVFLDNNSGTGVIKVRAGNSTNSFLLKNIETINLAEADDYVYVGRGYSSANSVTIDGKDGVNTIDFSNASAVEVTFDISTLAVTNNLVANVDFKNFTSVNGTNFSDTFKISGAVASYTPGQNPISLSGGAGVDTFDMSGIVGASEVNLIDGNNDNISFSGNSDVIISNFEIFKFANNDANNNTTVHIERADVNYLFDGNIKYDYSSNNIGFIYNFSVDVNGKLNVRVNKEGSSYDNITATIGVSLYLEGTSQIDKFYIASGITNLNFNNDSTHNNYGMAGNDIIQFQSTYSEDTMTEIKTVTASSGYNVVIKDGSGNDIINANAIYKIIYGDKDDTIKFMDTGIFTNTPAVEIYSFDGGGATSADELDFSDATVGLKVDLDSSKISLVDTSLGADNGYIAYKNFEKITLGDGNDIVSYSSSLGGVKEIDGGGGINAISYENKLSGNQIFDVGTSVSISGLSLTGFTSYVGTKYNDVFNINYTQSPNGIILDGYEGKLDVLNFNTIPSGAPNIKMVSGFDANNESVFNVTSNGSTFMVKNIEKFSFDSAVTLDVTFEIEDQSKNYEFVIEDGSDLLLDYSAFSSALIIDFNVGRVNIGSYTHKYGDNLSLASSINMGDGGDTVYLSNTKFPNVKTDVDLDGGNGNDTVSLAKFDINIPTTSVIDFVNDQITVEKNGIVVTYNVDNVESFVGSRQEDVFKVKADFGNESTYDGGGAPTGKKDTLDYSSYNSGNFVILVDSGIINKSATAGGTVTKDNFSNFQGIKIGATSGAQTVNFEDMSSNKSYVYDISISGGTGNTNMQATFDYSSFNTGVEYTVATNGDIVIKKNSTGTVTDTIIGDTDNIDKIILTSVDDRLVINDINDVPSVSLDGGTGTNIIDIEFTTGKGVELDLENQTIKEVGGTTTSDFNITGGFSVYNLANTNNVVILDALNNTNDKYRTINFTGAGQNKSSVDLSSFLSGTANLNSVKINVTSYNYTNQVFNLLIDGNGGEHVEVNSVNTAIFGTSADINYVNMSVDFYFDQLSAKNLGMMGDVFSATVDADVKRTVNATAMASGRYDYITVDDNFAISSGNDEMVINGVTYFRVENWSGVIIDTINLNLSGTNGIQSDIDMYFGTTNAGTINTLNVNGVTDGGYVTYNGAELEAQGDNGDILLDANLSNTSIKFGTAGNGLSSVSYTFKYDDNTDASLVDAEVLGDESVTYDMSSVTAKTSKDDILVDGTTGTVTYPYVVNGSASTKDIKGFSKVMLTSVDDSVVINNVPTTVNASGIYIIDGGAGKNSVVINANGAQEFVIGLKGDSILPGGVYKDKIQDNWAGTTPQTGRTMGVEDFSYYTINGGVNGMRINIRGSFNSIESDITNLEIRWDTTAISGVDFNNIEVGDALSNNDDTWGSIKGNYLGEDFTIDSTGNGSIAQLGAPINHYSNFVMDMKNIDANSSGSLSIGGASTANGYAEGNQDYMRFINVNTPMTLTLAQVNSSNFKDTLKISNGFVLNLYRIDKYDIDKNMTIKVDVNIKSLNRKMDFIAPSGTANNDFVATGQSANIIMKAFEGGSDLFVISDTATTLQFENFQRYDIDNSANTELIFNDFKVINHDRGQVTKNDTEFKLSGSGTSKVNMGAVADDLNIFYDASNKMYVGRDVDGYVVQMGATNSNGLMGVNTEDQNIYVYEFEEVNEITFGSGDDFFDGRSEAYLSATTPMTIDMGEGYDSFVFSKIGTGNFTISYNAEHNLLVNRGAKSVILGGVESLYVNANTTNTNNTLNYNIDMDNAEGYLAIAYYGKGTAVQNVSMTFSNLNQSDKVVAYFSPYLMSQLYKTGTTNANVDYLEDVRYTSVLNVSIGDNYTIGFGGAAISNVEFNGNNLDLYVDVWEVEPLESGKQMEDYSGSVGRFKNLGVINIVFFDTTHKTDFDSDKRATFNIGSVELNLDGTTAGKLKIQVDDSAGIDYSPGSAGYDQPGTGYHFEFWGTSVHTREATYEDQLKAEELLIGDAKFDSENETEEEKNLALMDYRYQQNVNYFNEMFIDFDDELNSNTVEENYVVVDNNDDDVNNDYNHGNQSNGNDENNDKFEILKDKLDDFANHHPNIVNKIENIMENNNFDGIGSGILIDNNFDGVNIEGAFDKIGQIDNYLKDILDGKYSEVMKSLKDVLENASDYNKSVLKDFANNIFENIVHKNSDYNSENIFVSAKEREEAKNENTMDENYQQKQDENNLAFEDFSDDAKNSLVEENQTEEVSAKKDDSKEEINLKDIFDALDSSSLSGKDVKDSAENHASYNNDVTHNISEDSLQIDLAEYSLEHAIKSDMHVGDDSAEKLNQQNKKSNSNLGGY